MIKLPEIYVYNHPYNIHKYFTRISERITNLTNKIFPIIINNDPSYNSVNIKPTTILEIYQQMPNLVAVVESSKNIDQISDILNLCDLKVFSNNDSMIIPALSLGCSGIFSDFSNYCPQAMIILKSYCLDNNYNDARNLYKIIHKLIKLINNEIKPVGIKIILENMKIISNFSVGQSLLDINSNYFDELIAELQFVDKELSEINFN